MPAPSPDAGEEIVEGFLRDEPREMPVGAGAGIGFAAVEAGVTPGRKRGRGLGFGAWLAMLWLAVLAGSAILAPFLPIDAATTADPSLSRQGPSLSHPFGIDTLGHDMVSQVIWGARNSLFIAIVAVFLGFVVGGVLGVVAGYFKGRIGGVLGSITDIFLAFPQLVLALSIVTFLGRTVFNVTMALAIVSTPVLARISRASTLTWSEREFVLASRAQGAKHGRVMLREVLPNILPAMFSIALLGVAVVIVAEAGLAVIGAGVNPNVVTWGNIIVKGSASELRDAPHIALTPSLVIFLTVLSLNYLGDVVRSRFDVRESAL